MKTAIDMIPVDSEYYTVVKFAWGECQKHADWESAWKFCEKKYERCNEPSQHTCELARTLNS